MCNQTILELLDSLIELLKKHQVNVWLEHLLDIRNAYHQSLVNARSQDMEIALAKLNTLFGGMGSFNDYVITSLHGDCVNREEEHIVNQKLNYLRRRLAKAVRDCSSS